ncbi:MAG: radical SAM protein [Deltaproteobacteria bacterium RBG_19FT_COMBO_46_12]|nr:MAG: radical SAM protein [Deltaproteobacteria bacterium RBG_19FT_COMBO_46_12]
MISSKVNEIVSKVFDGHFINREEIVSLLRIDPHSMEGGIIMTAANSMTRAASKGKAEVHAQIGLNLSPCPNNCSFCSFAAKNGIFKDTEEISIEEVIQSALRAEADGANAIFLMTTHDYSFGKYIELSKEVRRKLKPDTLMIANIGDFEYEEGQKLKEAGHTGIYHAMRLGEGRDTQINPETRLNTMKTARDAGLLIGTCVEPIGPEHSMDEIVEKILIGRKLNPCYSGAARRINIPGSELEHYGMISEYRLAFLVAVVRLAMGRELVGNCTHEPNILGATAGANLFWAEAGTNPRDTEVETSKGRGLDVKSCMNIFREAEFELYRGPSIIYSEHHHGMD